MNWIRENIAGCEAAVLSVDMLLYGGIVPSRLHRFTPEECLNRLNALRDLHREAPGCKLYAFNLIMRAPAYSSSEEEPDYYAAYGRALFEIGYLTDKAERAALSAEEADRLESRRREVPAEVIGDFTARRDVNPGSTKRWWSWSTRESSRFSWFRWTTARSTAGPPGSSESCVKK
jgi:hypothetical protein